MYHKILSIYHGIRITFLKFAILILLFLLIAVISGCTNKKLISFDFETYLSGNTEFEKKVSAVMLSKKELADSKIIYYMYYNNGEDVLAFAESMICLTVEYSDEKLIIESQRLEKLYEENYNEMGGEFYYNDTLYKSFQFYDDGYVALAYHICSNSRIVSYIVFSCNDLAYMDVGNALSFFVRTTCNDQIRQCQDSTFDQKE